MMLLETGKNSKSFSVRGSCGYFGLVVVDVVVVVVATNEIVRKGDSIVRE